MKRILILSAVLFTAMSAGYAQEQYKPAAGSITAEMEFVPFGNRPLNIDGIKARYFISDQLAVRLNLNFSLNNETEYTTQRINDRDIEQTEKISSSTFFFIPGIEYHFGNFEKLSPYAGAEIGILTGSNSMSRDNDGYVDGNTFKEKNSFFGIGVNIVAGADYYIYKGLYLGAEFGFGYSFRKTNPPTIVEKVNNQTTTTESKDYQSYSSFGFTPTTAIRLGWRF